MSNVTELNQIIQHYPLLLSYSLDTSVSRLDFFIQVYYVDVDIDVDSTFFHFISFSVVLVFFVASVAGRAIGYTRSTSFVF